MTGFPALIYRKAVRGQKVLPSPQQSRDFYILNVCKGGYKMCVLVYYYAACLVVDI